MRKMMLGLCVACFVFIATSAMAEEMELKWQDLGQSERNSILAQWKKQPQSERDPWVVFRDEYLQNMPATQKARYIDKVKQRVAREEEQERIFEERRKQQTLENAKSEGAEKTESEADEVIESSKTAVETEDTVVNETIQEETSEETQADDTVSQQLNPPIVRPREDTSEEEEKEEGKIKGFFKKMF